VQDTIQFEVPEITIHSANSAAHDRMLRARNSIYRRIAEPLRIAAVTNSKDRTSSQPTGRVTLSGEIVITPRLMETPPASATVPRGAQTKRAS
jgi:hypothetical protein